MKQQCRNCSRLLLGDTSHTNIDVTTPDRLLVESSLSSLFQRASFLAASSQHSGDWLYALPVASCGMLLDNEAVRVAIGLRLGLELCVPRQCHCGTQVDAFGRHAFVCKKAPNRSVRHHALNQRVARAFSAAAIPNSKEPLGLCRSDGKRPDGLTLVPWQSGRVEELLFGTSQSSVLWRTPM